MYSEYYIIWKKSKKDFIEVDKFEMSHEEKGKENIQWEGDSREQIKRNDKQKSSDNRECCV